SALLLTLGGLAIVGSAIASGPGGASRVSSPSAPDAARATHGSPGSAGTAARQGSVAGTPASGGHRSGRAAPGGTTVVTIADAYVDGGSPTRNYGPAPALRSGTSPTRRAYLKFTVPALNGSPQSVRLRLYATHGGSGFAV